MVRCNCCDKKVKSIFVDIQTCKCGNVYCSKHVHDHSCTFDYKSKQREKLTSELTRVTSQKIIKI